MTLVLTELSESGISMAADSAVTVTNKKTGISHVPDKPVRKHRHGVEPR